MAKEITRLQSFALWIEWTPGTEGTLDAYIPLTKWTLSQKVVKVTDESGLWVIDQVSDSFVTQKMSEFSAEWVLKSQSFWYLLLLALWTAWTPTLVETGVYSHAFTRKNDNSHPSATLFHDNATQEQKTLYNMLNTLELSFEVWEKAMFTTTLTWQSIQTATGLTPSFSTADEDFLVSNMSVKIADDVAWLAGASRIPVLNASLSIEKNLKQIFASKSSTTEALDFNSQHNQSFASSWELELVYDSTTYQTLFTAWTYKALEIEIVGRTLIWATAYNKITIRVPKVSIEDFSVSDSLDEIQTQTLWFIWMYKLSETATITTTLINTKSTQYA